MSGSSDKVRHKNVHTAEVETRSHLRSHCRSRLTTHKEKDSESRIKMGRGITSWELFLQDVHRNFSWPKSYLTSPYPFWVCHREMRWGGCKNRRMTLSQSGHVLLSRTGVAFMFQLVYSVTHIKQGPGDNGIREWGAKCSPQLLSVCKSWPLAWTSHHSALFQLSPSGIRSIFISNIIFPHPLQLELLLYFFIAF